MVPQAALERLSVERRETQFRGVVEADGSADAALRLWIVETPDGGPTGFALSGPSRDDDLPAGAGEILAIYLEPALRGQGLGRPLFDRAVDDLRARGFDPLVVWVLVANVPARRFYERAGWRADGASKPIDFDGTPVDEVRYRSPARD